MHAGLHSRSSAHANKNHHSLRHSSSLEEGLTNVEEDANESKGRNNRRSSSKLGNGFGGGGSSFWGGGRGGSSPSYGPSVLRSTRDKFGKKDPSISVWKRLQPLLFAAILIGFPLSNAVFFSAHM